MGDQTRQYAEYVPRLVLFIPSSSHATSQNTNTPERTEQIELWKQLGMDKMDCARQAKCTDERPQSAAEYTTAQLTAKKKIKNDIIARRDGEQPELVARKWARAHQTPGDVKRKKAEQRIAVGKDILSGETATRVPQCLSRAAQDSFISMFEEIVIQAGISRVGFHQSQAREDHCMEHKQQARDQAERGERN